MIFESHSTSVDNESGLASGWFNAALSVTGEDQARTLGARRRHDDLAAIFCSDLTRSFRTAEIAFGNRPLAIVRDARLRECDYGELTRGPITEIEQRRARHLTTPFPGGESYQQVVERVSGWFLEVTRQCDARTVLVIGHRATFYALEHLLRGATLHDAVTSTWMWQPGWTYHVTQRQSPASASSSVSRVS